VGIERDRFLIVNADDFGQSTGVNEGVVATHERGIVTSASLMVRWPAAAAAAVYARARPTLSVGLHVDLGEWVRRGDEWRPLYEVVDLHDRVAIQAEMASQLTMFRDLLGRDPTHLDSHQHVHRSEPARSVCQRAAATLGVPLRWYSDAIRYCGAFYGQSGDGHPVPDAIRTPALIGTLARLPAGVTELGCHPATGDTAESMYGPERASELETLCDPAVRATLAEEGIVLCSFASLPERVV